MATIIGTQDGIESTRRNLNLLDPGKTGYDKQAATLKALKLGHNEVHREGGIADRVKALEEAVPPFPLAHKGVFIAWGLYAGGKTFGSREPQVLAQKLSEFHFGWAAVQKRLDNDDLIPEFREACHYHGVKLGVWEDYPRPESGKLAVRDYEAEFYIAQVEGPNTELDAIASTRPDVPCAIVTNFGGLDNSDGVDIPALSQSLRDNGWNCLTEAYLPENPGLAPNPCAKLDFRAKRHGWTRSQPVIGCYWDLPASAYTELPDYPGFCVWLAESMTQSDWEYLGDL